MFSIHTLAEVRCEPTAKSPIIAQSSVKNTQQLLGFNHITSEMCDFAAGEKAQPPSVPLLGYKQAVGCTLEVPNVGAKGHAPEWQQHENCVPHHNSLNHVQIDREERFAAEAEDL
jgi:hypothetical protein